jgi:hypothetical protein
VPAPRARPPAARLIGAALRRLGVRPPARGPAAGAAATRARAPDGSATHAADGPRRTSAEEAAARIDAARDRLRATIAAPADDNPPRPPPPPAPGAPPPPAAPGAPLPPGDVVPAPPPPAAAGDVVPDAGEGPP